MMDMVMIYLSVFIFSKSRISTPLPYLEEKKNMSKILDLGVGGMEVEIPLHVQIHQIQ